MSDQDKQRTTNADQDCLPPALFAFATIAALFSYCQAMPENSSTLALYCGTIAISCLFARFSQCLYQARRVKTSILVLACSLGGLFILFALRAANAIDDPSYMAMFSSVRAAGITGYTGGGGVEVGYTFLLWVIGLFTDDYMVVQVVTGAIPFIVLGIALVRLSNKGAWFIVVYLFATNIFFQMQAVNLSRMFIAIAFVVLSITELLDRHVMRYLLCIFSAALFHASALIMLPFACYCFANGANARQKCTLALTTVIPIALIAILVLLIPSLTERYQGYTYSGIGVEDLLSTATRLPLLALFLVFDKDCDNNIRIMRDVFFCSIVIKAFGIASSFGRILYYFDMFYVIGFAMLYSKPLSGKKRIALLTALLIYGFTYLYFTRFLPIEHQHVLFPYSGVLFTV